MNEYLGKSTTKNEEKDDYGHLIPAGERVAKCHYLEMHREIRQGIAYYTEDRKITRFLLLHCRDMSSRRDSSGETSWHNRGDALCRSRAPHCANGIGTG